MRRNRVKATTADRVNSRPMHHIAWPASALHCRFSTPKNSKFQNYVGIRNETWRGSGISTIIRNPALTKYKKKDQDEVSTVRIHQGSFHSDRLAISIEEQEERGQKKARRMVAKSHVWSTQGLHRLFEGIYTFMYVQSNVQSTVSYLVYLWIWRSPECAVPDSQDPASA